MNSTSENPYASPKAEEPQPAAAEGTFDGLCHTWLKQDSSFRFVLGDRALLAGYVGGPILNSLQRRVGCGLAAALPVSAGLFLLWDLYEEIAFLNGSRIAGLSVVGGLLIAVLTLGELANRAMTGRRRIRSQRYDMATRTLEVFQQIDPRSFALRPDEVASIRVTPRSHMWVLWCNHGALEFRYPPRSKRRPMRVFIANKVDLSALCDRLVGAGFTVKRAF